jgi:RNA polymerase sigma-70 factor (ECF subfamily)
MADLGGEQQWIRDSLAGDEAAFAALVQQHQQMIHALTFRMTGSAADAQDLAQDTFARAFQQLDRFRGDSKFSTWLCRIAVNACLNWRRREGRRAEVHERWAADALPDGRVHTDHRAADDRSAEVQAALDQLPPPQRAAVVLTVYEGMNHAEAARVLGCSETTVSWRLFTARKKLRRMLEAS